MKGESNLIKATLAMLLRENSLTIHRLNHFPITINVMLAKESQVKNTGGHSKQQKYGEGSNSAHFQSLLGSDYYIIKILLLENWRNQVDTLRICRLLLTRSREQKLAVSEQKQAILKSREKNFGGCTKLSTKKKKKENPFHSSTIC